MTDTLAEMPEATRAVAVLTGGGDAQGMNAALRSVSRMAISCGCRVYGIRDGFYGLHRLAKTDRPLDETNGHRSIVDKMKWDYMSWAIRDGGSALGTIRCDEIIDNRPLQEDIVRKLTSDCHSDSPGPYGLGADSLVVIGGNGSISGAHALSLVAQDLAKREELTRPLSVVAIPASIDNDVPDTEISIGVDSALNVIVESIDKLVDTTSAVNRAIVVETMGKKCGYLAVFASLASGAAEVFCRERRISRERFSELLSDLDREYASERRTAVIVVAEGGKQKRGFVADTVKDFRTRPDDEAIRWDVRESVLGHLQRGGPTSAFDRILASRMGARAVELLSRRDAAVTPRMVQLQDGEINFVSLDHVVQKIKNGETAVSGDVLLGRANLVRELSSLPAEDLDDDCGRIVVLTGGADAQGMNMAIRAAARYALNKYRVETIGSKNSFTGLIEKDLRPLPWSEVGKSKMRQRRAGSVLGTERWPLRFEPDQKRQILETLKELNERDRLRGLVLIGGLGTALRAQELRDYLAEHDLRIRIVYVPASIDHGLPATHATLGFDTALNVVVSSCDKITDTSQAMKRVSIVDTMGGGVGALTLMGALAAGAECAIIAEDLDPSRDGVHTKTSLEEATGRLKDLRDDISRPDHRFATVLLQHRQFLELDLARLHGRADEIFGSLEARRTALGQTQLHSQAGEVFGSLEVRKTALGYTQRGGNASYWDRLLGTLMGVEAVKAIMDDSPIDEPKALLVRLKGDRVEAMDLAEALQNIGGGKPWSEATRMENAKICWRYGEMKELFRKISVFREPSVGSGSDSPHTTDTEIAEEGE